MSKIDDFGEKFIFLPDATRGAVRGLTSSQLEDVGVEGIVVNTLHLLISPGPDTISDLGGIHKYMNWEGPILSDSGGFQVFSLLHSGKWKGVINDNGVVFKSPRDGTEYTLTPESSIDIQMKLGTDILVVLDDCRKGVTTESEAMESVSRTLEWAESCKKHYIERYSEKEREGKILTAVVQGANFKELREKCARRLVEIGFDGYNFGGYLLDDKGELVEDQLRTVVENTPADKFNYAMGLGKPEDILLAAQIGYTVFDTVIPTRNARHGTLYSMDTKDGVLRIHNAKYALDNNPIDSKCDCEACKRHSRAYVHHLLRSNEMTGMNLATIHNLRFFQRLINYMNSNKDSLEELSYQDFLRS